MAINEGLALAELSELAGLYIPLAAPPCGGPGLTHVAYPQASPYHASALLAAALDTALLPARVSGVISMDLGCHLRAGMTACGAANGQACLGLMIGAFQYCLQFPLLAKLHLIPFPPLSPAPPPPLSPFLQPQQAAPVGRLWAT